jgi:hypothetical protein
MSDATITIAGSERQALRQLLIQRITGVTDPGLMIRQRGFRGRRAVRK